MLGLRNQLGLDKMRLFLRVIRKAVYSSRFTVWGGFSFQGVCGEGREVFPADGVGATTHHCGAKSAGARISHTSVSGNVSASKEKRGGSESGDIAVKLGGQENRVAPVMKTGCRAPFGTANLSRCP